jgi:multidrug efflux system outer membrane protein
VLFRSARLWSIAAGVTGPLFEGGRLIGEYRGARAVWDQAALQYQQTALAAFQEVADALATRDKIKDIVIRQALAVKAYEETVGLALDRYTFGKANYYEVIEAQQQLFTAQIVLAKVQRDQFLAVVQLYKALGGGWKIAEPPQQAAAPKDRADESAGVPLRLVSEP